jgi:rRNA maturation endonuclease Nob1
MGGSQRTLGRLIELAGLSASESRSRSYVCRSCGRTFEVQYHVCPECGGYSVDPRDDQPG